jgi:hypothetical protein
MDDNKESMDNYSVEIREIEDFEDFDLKQKIRKVENNMEKLKINNSEINEEVLKNILIFLIDLLA